jgi:hypothetical protein
MRDNLLAVLAIVLGALIAPSRSVSEAVPSPVSCTFVCPDPGPAGQTLTGSAIDGVYVTCSYTGLFGDTSCTYDTVSSDPYSLCIFLQFICIFFSVPRTMEHQSATIHIVLAPRSRCAPPTPDVGETLSPDHRTLPSLGRAAKSQIA